MSLYYVYCLGEGLTGEAVAGAAGLGGAPVRLLTRAGLAAVVSPFGEEPVPVTREHVRAHNRVNSLVLARATPLPFRFGTLATGERLAAYLEEREAALRAALEAVRGCVEMSVKVMWGNAGAGGETGAGEDGGDGGARGAGAGTAFLLAKRRELTGDEDSKSRAGELAAWVESRVAGLARASDVRLRPSESLAVRAAHLVARGRVAEYRGRLRALHGERPDLRFLTSGPWPPYSFTEDKKISDCRSRMAE